ncbi:MAG: cytochrome o ubiquinol oxidase subunit IV [Parachlamydiaceae bacterium]|nr:cytochrome o ubiquinol oxidase subunit IV [Parachlamydiaceae bacterium]
MHSELNLQQIKKEWHGSLKAYLIGFTLALLLTGLSFLLVITKALTGQALINTIIGLALLQATVQLIFFLHIGQEAKPRWETFIFCFMVLVLLIIVLGSLWIMSDLNDRVMPGMMEGMSS